MGDGPLGITQERVLMLMEQQGRRRASELRDLATVVRVAMSDEAKIDESFPVAPDPALTAQSGGPTKFDDEKWW